MIDQRRFRRSTGKKRAGATVLFWEQAEQQRVLTITSQPETPRVDHDGAPPKVRLGMMARVFWVFAALALLSLAINVAGRYAGRTIAMAGHTDDRSIREVVIGNAVLRVPANMIRFEEARRDGVAQRLDLYVLWPTMQGYTHETRHAFNHVDGERSLVFIAFEDRMMSRDMSGRLEPIYRPMIEKQARSGPGGLAVHRFSAKSGYVDEVLVIGSDGRDEPFVARCLSGSAAADSLAPCERDIHVGTSLNLVYRFPAELAGSWRELDDAVRRIAEGMLGADNVDTQSRSISRMAIEKL